MAGKDYETRENNNQMKNESSMGSREFMVGAVIGGLVGAAAALFLAPKSGRELRDTINQQAGSVKEKTVQLKDNVVSKSTDIVNMTKEKSASITQTVTQQKDNLLNKAKSLTGSEASENNQKETEYISINPAPVQESTTADFDDLTLADDTDVRRKLEEAKKALDEEESKLTR
ncbi:YtxH domain-containing protein [Neobacillus terrae]|uniref:YtxH domain-containing protein n=1 Tax=Neobacillus terrae TaxID=3034837 RepID=UPI00140969EB|nr:YtxH domain-containing protein [Neobacillus terrae]NHM30628.1 YtxH domain-containing protein [Neobacillus terrae]